MHVCECVCLCILYQLYHFQQENSFIFKHRSYGGIFGTAKQAWNAVRA